MASQNGSDWKSPPGSANPPIPQHCHVHRYPPSPRATSLYPLETSRDGDSLQKITLRSSAGRQTDRNSLDSWQELSSPDSLDNRTRTAPPQNSPMFYVGRTVQVKISFSCLRVNCSYTMARGKNTEGWSLFGWDQPTGSFRMGGEQFQLELSGYRPIPEGWAVSECTWIKNMTREGKSENIWVEKQINYFFRLYLKGVGNPSHSAVTYEKRIKKKRRKQA